MQALIELLAGFIALLAITALAQFGVDLNTSARPDREVHRVGECGGEPTKTMLISKPARDC